MHGRSRIPTTGAQVPDSEPTGTRRHELTVPVGPGIPFDAGVRRSPTSVRSGSTSRRTTSVAQIDKGLDNATISSYCAAMRRKEGALVPLEVSILEAALDLRSRGIEEAHGFLLAKELRDGAHADA